MPDGVRSTPSRGIEAGAATGEAKCAARVAAIPMMWDSCCNLGGGSGSGAGSGTSRIAESGEGPASSLSLLFKVVGG